MEGQPGAQKERSFEIGKDESWFANVKRTYDEYQHESLESIRRNRNIVDKLISDAQQHDNQRQVIANQALQNAVETANMVGKQAHRHSDVAIDGHWTYNNELGQLLGAKSGVQADLVQAIAASVAAAVLAELAKQVKS